MQNPLIFSELLRQLLLGMSFLTDVQNTLIISFFFFSFCQVNSKLNNLKTRHADFFFFFNHLSKHLKKNKVRHHILLGIKQFLLIGMLLCCIWNVSMYSHSSWQKTLKCDCQQCSHILDLISYFPISTKIFVTTHLLASQDSKGLPSLQHGLQ